jgi:hypothetical protein
LSDTLLIRKELKDKFLRDLTPGEQIFFLKKAREATAEKGYPVNEDLFHYCYFLTMKERLSGIDSRGGEGFMRFLLVEALRDMDQEIKFYQERLESRKRKNPDVKAYALLERSLKKGIPDES